MKGANTETKVVYKNVTKIDVVCKKNVAKKIRNGLTICTVSSSKGGGTVSYS